MVVGFNHNFAYKGVVYHIQTEDNGRKSATIVTLLYVGGTILASRKTSYADIARVDNLEQVVEELMKEQHKGMLRSLKAGEFDDVIARFEKSGSVAAAPAETVAPAPPQVSPAPAIAAAPPVPSPQTAPRPAPPPSPTPAAAPETRKPAAAVESSLDEIILSYLMGEEK